MSQTLTGAQLMAEAFRQETDAPVFNVMGDMNMDWLIEMGRTPGAVINARDEGAAVSMADGYARTTGDVGVASATGGPGLTHTATALRAAVHYRTPVVLLAGQAASQDNIQYLDQRRFVEALGAASVDVADVGRCMDDVRKAFFLARTERRPVALNVPAPLFKARVAAPKTYMGSRQLLAATREAAPDPDAIREVADLLRTAQRPLVLVGRGAVGPGCAEPIRALARTVGALTASTLPAFGWNQEAEGDLGLAGFFASPAKRELLQAADCVLVLGASLHAFATDGDLYAGAKVILADRLTAPAYNTASQVDLHVQGDAAAVVRLLNIELAGYLHGAWRTPQTLAKAREAAAAAVDPIEILDGRVDPRLVARALDEALPKDRVSVTGAGHFWNFGVRHMGPPLNLRLVTHGFGSIGHGMTTAIGAMAASTGRPGLVYEGDSGLLMNIQELDTLARLGLHLLVVVMNNTALGSEYYKLKSEHRDPADSVLNDVDFAAIARGFGVRAATLREGAHEVAPLVAEFMATPAPMLIDVKTSLDVVDENYRWW